MIALLAQTLPALPKTGNEELDQIITKIALFMIGVISVIGFFGTIMTLIKDKLQAVRTDLLTARVAIHDIATGVEVSHKDVERILRGAFPAEPDERLTALAEMIHNAVCENVQGHTVAGQTETLVQPIVATAKELLAAKAANQK